MQIKLRFHMQFCFFGSFGSLSVSVSVLHFRFRFRVRPKVKKWFRSITKKMNSFLLICYYEKFSNHAKIISEAQTIRLCTIGPPARARPTGRRAFTGSGLKIENPARPEPVKIMAGRRSGFLPDGL